MHVLYYFVLQLHVFQLAVDVASALVHLHLKGIAHSDLTPSNILLKVHKNDRHSLLWSNVRRIRHVHETCLCYVPDKWGRVHNIK